jgi:hypothetical protein
LSGLYPNSRIISPIASHATVTEFLEAQWSYAKTLARLHRERAELLGDAGSLVSLRIAEIRDEVREQKREALVAVGRSNANVKLETLQIDLSEQHRELRYLNRWIETSSNYHMDDLREAEKIQQAMSDYLQRLSIPVA